MAIQLGSAYGKVALDMKGLLDGVKQGKVALSTLAEAGEKVGAGLQNAGRKLTLGLTLPIAALSGAAVKAASDFEETKNKAIVVFEDMADGVISNANKAATTLGLSRTQYLDYASSLGAAFKAGGLNIEESTKLSEQAIKHFADLSSFHNGNVQEIAEAWQSAIRGQYEPIQRYFPFITNEYLKTYGTANGLVDANTDKLTANQRAIILNAIALDEKLNPAIDDFAETSGGLANQGRITSAQFHDLLILLGQNLLPIVGQIVIWLNKLLEALNKMSPGTQKLVLGFLALAAALGPVLSVLGTLITTISSIVGFVGALTGVQISIAGIGTAITGTLLPAIGSVLVALGPVILTVLAVAAVVGLLYLAWKKNLFGIQDLVAKSAAGYRQAWQRFTDWWKANSTEAAESVHATFAQLPSTISGSFQNIVRSVGSAWSNFMNWLRNALSSMRTYIANAFTNVNWSTIGKNILLGLANGMLLGIPNLLLIVKRVAESVLTQIKKSLGIKSPSSEAMKLGMFTAQGFALGMQTMNPEDITRSLTKPITSQTNSQQQNFTMHFASGLTIRDVHQAIAQNNEQLMNSMISALGGA